MFNIILSCDRLTITSGFPEEIKEDPYSYGCKNYTIKQFLMLFFKAKIYYTVIIHCIK